jgi:hypothetical protein
MVSTLAWLNCCSVLLDQGANGGFLGKHFNRNFGLGFDFRSARRLRMLTIPVLQDRHAGFGGKVELLSSAG